MKLYLLQGVSSIQGTGDTNTIGLFCSKPTLKDLQTIFNNYKKYKPTDKDLLNILNGRYSRIGDYEYTLEMFELDNKEILVNMDEKIKVLVYNNIYENLETVTTFTGDVTADKIPKEDLKNVLTNGNDKSEEQEFLKNFLSGGSVRNYYDEDGIYGWIIINTKDIK